MKSTITKIAIATGVFFCVMVVSVEAQVLPGPGVNYVCQGGTITIAQDPATIGATSWQVRYSETETDTPMDVEVTVTGNVITTKGTGYYYLYGINAEGCESDPQELKVYELAPLTVTISGDDYCTEDVSAAELTANITVTDPNVENYAYQWFTVKGGVEEAILDANGSTYKPTETTEGAITYKVKTGYLIGSDKYCSVTPEKEITVLPKPTTPSITIGSTAETW